MGKIIFLILLILCFSPLSDLIAVNRLFKKKSYNRHDKPKCKGIFIYTGKFGTGQTLNALKRRKEGGKN